MKSNFKNITNHSIENMDVDVASSLTQENGPSMSTSPSPSPSNDNPGMLPYMDIMMNTEILNITLFYADWCGHCKKFKADTWGHLREKFQTNKEVQLNEIDCTNIKSALETPAGKSIEGFPTLILNYKDTDGKYIEEEYNGPRSLQVLSTVIDKFTNIKH
jgi:thiol-disulfide isomerase/thioredoxin